MSIDLGLHIRCQDFIVINKSNKVNFTALTMKETKMTRVLSLLLGTLVLTSMPLIANANIIGFDFGSSFFKVTLVQPGNPF